MADAAFRSTTGRLNWRTGTNIWQELRQWIELPCLALLMIFAAYGFRLGGFALPSGTWLTVPAAPYFQGIVFQLSQSQTPHTDFLMGMYSSNGWRYYYLAVCALKIPVSGPKVICDRLNYSPCAARLAQAARVCSFSGHRSRELPPPGCFCLGSVRGSLPACQFCGKQTA
jgi:hypothetical protein